MKEIIKKIASIISCIFVGITTILSFIFLSNIWKKNDENKQKIAESKKEETENEIKKTNASDLIKQSDNADDIQQSIEQQQQEFRERVRNRLKQNL